MRTFESAQGSSKEELERMDDPDEDYIVINRSKLDESLLERLEDQPSSLISTPDEIMGVSQGTSPGSGYQPPTVGSGGGGSSLEDVLGDISDAIESGEFSIDPDRLGMADRSQKEILSVIASLSLQTAEMQRNMLDVMGTQARLGVRQSQELGNINYHLSPARAITVSGTNSTNDPDVPERVVPESANEDIPTNTLYIRAARGNDTPIYFGDDQVAPNSGFALYKGEAQTIKMNLVDQGLYMASEQAGQTVELMGVV